VSRMTQAVVLMLFGGAILRASFTGTYLRYVKAGLQPYLIAAGVLLVAAAVMTLWQALRSRSAHDHSAAEDDGHGHAHHEPRVGWLLVLPVLGLLLVTPPALGAYSAGQAGSVALQSGDSNYPPLPPGNPAPVGLLDYASRAVFDGGKSLSGRTLEMSGFLTKGADGRPMLARIVLTCCAADGRPIKIGLDGPVAVDAAANSWVQVIGTYSSRVGKDPVSKSDVAYVTVKSWQQISEPPQPYA